MEEKKFDEVETICKKLLKELPQYHSIQMNYIQILLSNCECSDIKSFIDNEVCKENISSLYFSLYSCVDYEKSKKNIMRNNRKER